MIIKEGDKAPNFSTVDQKGQNVELLSFLGQKVLLYFYPKDSTPTCTIQSCNLRDNYAQFVENKIKVFGISVSSLKAHNNFISKHSLPFDLLLDTDHEICKLYGVWQEKKTFGKTYMGIVRTSFIINEKGFVEKVIDKVRAKEHSSQIF